MSERFEICVRTKMALYKYSSCPFLFYYQRKLHQMYHSFVEMDQGHVPYIYLSGVLYVIRRV